jgi:hypothetical protein
MYAKNAVRNLARKIGGRGRGKKIFSVKCSDGRKRYKWLENLALNEFEGLNLESTGTAELYNDRMVRIGNGFQRAKLRAEMEARQIRISFEENPQSQE